jgi:hypothetical protein
MYNQYLSQFPVDVTPQPVTESPEAPQTSPTASSNNSLFSLLSGALTQQSGLEELLSAENLIVLAVLLFLTYQEDGWDAELLILAVLLLLIGL